MKEENEDAYLMIEYWQSSVGCCLLNTIVASVGDGAADCGRERENYKIMRKLFPKTEIY